MTRRRESTGGGYGPDAGPHVGWFRRGPADPWKVAATGAGFRDCWLRLLAVVGETSDDQDLSVLPEGQQPANKPDLGTTQREGSTVIKSLRESIAGLTKELVGLDAVLAKARHAPDLESARMLLALVKMVEQVQKTGGELKDAILKAAAPLFDQDASGGAEPQG